MSTSPDEPARSAATPHVPGHAPGAGTDTVWPAWVRYPLLGLLAVVVLVGLASALTTGVDGAVVRILVATVLVPALLAPVVWWGRARRSRRSAGVRGVPAAGPAPRHVPTVADLAGPIRAAGHGDYAARLERAGAPGATATEQLYEARQVLQELLREQRRLPRDLEDQVHTLVGEISSLH